ncbi:MAG TPA: alpha/beta fold hydrolase [Gaiellaceae bacterium]|jgi:pimeloyl-ACP methyl ester carboxylesterase|nr:alpha/beta fold hydrolase [Gaiellaceae bacterium]
MPIPPYDEVGTGPAVLFGHGTMMDRSMFEPQLGGLSDRYRVIAFDHRARTANWRGPYSLDDLADDVVELLDSLGIERCVLGGMSMGGFVALRFALRHQDRLAGLVLIDTLASAPVSPHEELFGNLRDGDVLGESVVEWHADIVFGPTTKKDNPELVEHWKERWRRLTGASVYWESASWLRREDVAARLPEIAVPTLVIHGEEDEILPMEGAEQMATHVQHGRLARLAGAGHTSNTERPEEVNAVLRQFLDEVHASS